MMKFLYTPPWGGRNFERNKRCDFITRSHRFDYLATDLYLVLFQLI